jgi:hypothetical protein
MTSCASCGAALPAAAEWCSQCYASVPPAGGFRPGANLPTAAVRMRTTRWGKTPTTFGPIGRVVATFGLLIPLAIMTAGGFAIMFSWGGALIYAAIILPWGLRDVWQAGRVPER